jgi:hypothetical protein
LIFLISGCSKETELPQEGDIVLWKQNNALVIKAKLGQRREHMPKYKIFEPELERYVGQFPIDYQPERFMPISKEEIDRLEFPSAIHQLEFSLMLNGKVSKATNLGLLTGRGLDDPNQVKVKLMNVDPVFYEKVHETQFLNTREKIEYRLNSKNLDESSKFTDYGMTCYRFTKNIDETSKAQLCFGTSVHPLVSGFYLYISEESNYISVSSNELIFGGIQLRWVTHKQNIHQVKKIDTAIWRLLDTWNVAKSRQ